MSWLSKRRTKSSTSPQARTIMVGGVSTGSALIGPIDYDAGWEYLYLASEIARGLHDLDERYGRYLLGEVVPSGATVSDPLIDAPARSKAIGEVGQIIDELFEPRLLEKAFGPPGSAGDEPTIRYVAHGIIGVFQTCLEWGEEIRGTAVPIEWQPLYLALADYVTLPMQQIRKFSVELSALAKEIADSVREGTSPPQHQELVLRISIDPDAVERFESALEALKDAR